MYLKWDQVMYFLRKLPPFANFPNNWAGKFIMLACLFIHPSICMEQLGSHRTIFVKFYVGSSFTNISDHSQVWCNWDTNYRHFMWKCLYIWVTDFDNGEGLCSLWDMNWGRRNRWQPENNNWDRLWYLWGLSWKLKTVDNLNITTEHGNCNSEKNGVDYCKDMEKTCRDSNKVNASEVLCPANVS